MIDFDDVSITYADASAPALRHVDLHVDEGELCVAIGPTGTGKSTLLGAVNGLVPHFTGGRIDGRVRVAGRDTRDHRPRDLADVVGVVGQDPLAGFVTDVVEHELAYTMEQLGLEPAVMRKRVEETLDLLGLADLRDRHLRTLSAGQQQRVAIGSVLTAHPRVLVLDEPTSALDPAAAEEVLAAITRLVHDLGVTVLIAEHRLERIVQYADVVAEVRADGTVVCGPAAEVMRTSAVAPPVIDLGRLAGWDPLPLSVRDARRRAGELLERLADPRPAAAPGAPVGRGAAVEPGAPAHPGGPALEGADLTVAYGAHVAVRDVTLDLHAGEVVALMGRNGSGKSSLLWALQGSGPRQGGRVRVDGDDPADLPADGARRLVGLVPQDPTDLLYLASVAAECRQADRESEAPDGTCAALLADLLGPVDHAVHPRDLSEGQRLALVLAIQLSARPAVLLLDEPTRGLDYHAKDRLGLLLRGMAQRGAAVLVSTHDVEFVAGTCDRVVVLAQGEVVADGPTAEVVLASPTFAPQVAKILSPQSWLTVAQVEAALAVRT